MIVNKRHTDLISRINKPVDGVFDYKHGVFYRRINVAAEGERSYSSGDGYGWSLRHPFRFKTKFKDIKKVGKEIKRVAKKLPQIASGCAGGFLSGGGPVGCAVGAGSAAITHRQKNVLKGVLIGAGEGFVGGTLAKSAGITQFKDLTSKNLKTVLTKSEGKLTKSVKNVTKKKTLENITDVANAMLKAKMVSTSGIPTGIPQLYQNIPSIALSPISQSYIPPMYINYGQMMPPQFMYPQYFAPPLPPPEAYPAPREEVEAGVVGLPKEFEKYLPYMFGFMALMTMVVVLRRD